MGHRVLRVLLMGPPGGGKGTVGKMMATDWRTLSSPSDHCICPFAPTWGGKAKLRPYRSPGLMVAIHASHLCYTRLGNGIQILRNATH